MRTPLTFYGGKQALARQILPLMPSHRVYLEPFAGGARPARSMSADVRPEDPREDALNEEAL